MDSDKQRRAAPKVLGGLAALLSRELRVEFVD
jgi:hypothetical protein